MLLLDIHAMDHVMITCLTPSGTSTNTVTELWSRLTTGDRMPVTHLLVLTSNVGLSCDYVYNNQLGNCQCQSPQSLSQRQTCPETILIIIDCVD